MRRWFYLWRDNGMWLTINPTLLIAAREADGREALPSAAVIDSQSVKSTESGRPCGYDAGKKIKGRKRHILTDTDGNLVHAVVHAVDIQDRDGAPLVLAEIIKRSDVAKGFKVIHRRWVVERTIAWLNRNRRLANIAGSVGGALTKDIRYMLLRTRRGRDDHSGAKSQNRKFRLRRHR